MNQKKKVLLINLIFMLGILAIILLLPQEALAQTVDQQDYKLVESIQHDFIKAAWKYVLGLLNAIVVLGLIFVAIANILRLNIETYHIKRMLPSIILGVILANFSYVICRVVIDFAQVVADFFISGVTGDNIVEIFGFKSLVGMGAGAGTVIGVIGGFGLAATVGTGGAFAIGGGIFIIVAAAVIIGLPSLLILFLGFLLAVRIYLTWFLVIVSPIAFFSLLFTPLNKVWQTWWSWFIKWIFMAPIAFLFIKIASIVAGVDWPEGTGPGFAKWFFGIVLFCLAIYIPYMLGDKIVSGWANLWKGLARGGFKGLRYAGVGAGGAMMGWGENRAKADKKGWFTNFLQMRGEGLQATSFDENMLKELPQIPGGYGMAAALEAAQSRRQREMVSRGLHAATAGMVGSDDLDTSYQLKAAEIYTNPLFGINHMTNKIHNKDKEFKEKAWKMAVTAKNPKEILQAFGPGDKEAARFAVGLNWAFGREVENGTSELWNEKFREAFLDPETAGVDLNTPITDEERDDPNLQHIKEAKEKYNLGYQRTKSIRGIPRAPVMSAEEEPPAPGPDIMGGMPDTKEFAQANARAVANYLQTLTDKQIEYLRRIPALRGDMSSNKRAWAVLKERIAPHLEGAREVLVEKNNAAGLKNVDSLIQHQEYVTKIKQVIETEPATPSEIPSAISELRRIQAGQTINPDRMNQIVDLITRISPRQKNEIEPMKSNPDQLLRELQIANTALKSVAGHELPTQEKTVTQTTQVKVEPKVETPPQTPPPPKQTSATVGGGGELPAPPKTAPKSAESSASPNRTPETATSPTIAGLRKDLAKAESNKDNARVIYLKDAIDKLLGKK